MKAANIRATILIMIVFMVPMRVCPAGFVHFTGAQLYAAAATGGLNSGIDNSYRHSTNSTDTGASILGFVAGSTIPNETPISRGISFQLITGLNTFSFATASASSPGSYVGLNLFFSGVNASYNPSGAKIGGHLTAEKQLGSAGDVFSIPSTSFSVQNYAFQSASNDKPSANALDSYVVGEVQVEVQSFTATWTDTSGIRGTITLKVTATPEPGTLGLGSLAIVGIVGVARRRFRRKA